MVETENCVSLRITHINALNLRALITYDEVRPLIRTYPSIITRKWRTYMLSKDALFYGEIEFFNRLTLNDMNDEELTKAYRLDRNMIQTTVRGISVYSRCN